MEAAVDAELDKTENLDEDDYARIRAKRVQEMKRKAENDRQHLADGHGKLHKADGKEFFEYTKKSQKVVCVFNRNSNRHGKDILMHVEAIAAKHMETKFIWVDAENAPFLTDKLNIYMLPTICCIKDNKVHKQHNGLNDLSGTGVYTTGTLEYLLHTDEMIDDAPMYDQEIQEANDFSSDEEEADFK